MINIKAFLVVCIVIVSCGDNTQPGPAGGKDSVRAEKAIVKDTMKTIVFFGNSITAGYGLEMSDAFPAHIQHKIDSLDLPYKVVNAGVSGETSSGGNGRIDWVLRQPVDVFVLELGGNDGLRGIPVTETRKNLQSIIDKVKAKNPGVKIIIAGMQIPPNMGKQYTTEFRSMYPELAKNNDIALIPFLLEGVGGEAKFNLDDGIHPTPEGHKILAENVWKVLGGMIGTVSVGS
jgi:acyl-CoA thioesterase I